METLENRVLNILGSSAAVPTKDRNHTSQFLSVGRYKFLIDCGEGTQYQLLKSGVRFFKLDAIFISHLHGDHYLGLFGLINTLGLNGRTEPIKIFCPPGLSTIFKVHQAVTGSQFKFELEWIELNDSKHVLWSDDELEIQSFPVKHRIQCFGFRFDHGNKLRKLAVEKCNEYHVPVEAFRSIKQGEDYLVGEQLIPNHELTVDPAPIVSYSYITDSLYFEDSIPYVKDSDWLYHEATFLEADKDKAHSTYHSTALEAAQFATKAKVNNLILGHFSSRYLFLEDHLQEARSQFQSVFLGVEGKKFNL